MKRGLSLALLVGLCGCGSTIGSFDNVPPGPDVSAVPWPRLVDTPEPPEARLTAGNGERAVGRLSEKRLTLADRRARADVAQPVSETLVARGQENAARTSDAGSGFDEADLLARAAKLRERRQASLALPNSTELEARGSVSQGRNTAAAADVATPRRPVPLRPLGTPVVSDSFEQRARQARERAALSGG